MFFLMTKVVKSSLFNYVPNTRIVIPGRATKMEVAVTFCIFQKHCKLLSVKVSKGARPGPVIRSVN